MNNLRTTAHFFMRWIVLISVLGLSQKIYEETVSDANAQEFENAPTMQTQVITPNSDGSSNTASFNISIDKDADEYGISTVSNTNSNVNSVTELPSVGDEVGVTAFAEELNVVDNVTYSLNSDPGNAFATNSVNGAEPSTEIRVKEGPPPGFEELVRPQTTEVDIFYGDEKYGSAMATFSPQSIELLSPNEVVALIPNIIDPTVVANALSGPLDTNAPQVCLTDIQRECGMIEPTIAGVIFDESRFELHIFINELQLQPQRITSTKFLPEITSPEFSSVSSFASSISGEDGETAYTTGANHILSYGQSRLQAQWDYSDTQKFSVNTLSLQDDRAGIAKELGYFNTDTFFSSFTRELDVVGARIYGSTNMRTDLERSQATEIFLFLNSRSQVEVYKDDKLIDGGFYQTGNQQLDTSRLPSGSYPIRLRITDSAGNTREEQFFFVKSSILPPMDQPLHYFETGLLEKNNSQESLPELSSSEIVRLGTAHRLSNNLGTTLEFLHTADNDLLQGGVSYFGPGYFLQNSAMMGTDGEWGLQMLGQFRHENLSLNLDYRQVESDSSDESEVQILPSEFKQGNISANIPFRRGTVILRTQFKNTPNEGSTESYGFDYRYPLLNRNRYSIEFNFSSVLEEDDYSIQSGIRITKTTPSQFININPNYVAQETNDDLEQGLQLFAGVNNNYQHPDYGKFTIGSFVSEELERSTIGTRTDNSSTFGRADVQLEWVDDDARGNFMRYRGSQNANILSNDGQFAFGGDRNASSGIILEINGTPKNEPFEIYVDGQPRGYAKVGRRTVLPLAAFNTYRINIRSKSDELLEFDEGYRKVTLYPGNVQTISYEVSPITVLITRILLKDNMPASRMRVENAIGYAVTDEDGWLQAEISDKESLELSKDGKVMCNIDLPTLEIQQGVAFVESLICK